jgi:rRNA processing protein Gar1
MKLIAGLILFAGLAAAHHSFEAEYFTEKTTTVTGVVTKVDWQNPHAYIYINTKDETGAIRSIRAELGPPYALVRGGWKKESVKIGDTVTVEGAALPKDPRNSWVGALPTTMMVLSTGEKLPMR